MKKYDNLYGELISSENLLSAYKRACKGKTKKDYVKEFDKYAKVNLLNLCNELKSYTYKPKPLVEFIVKDPKTRRIHKSDFRDRIVHHALYNILNPIYEKIFIYDSCAGRKNKGNLHALKRFEFFMRKVSKNGRLAGKRCDSNYIKGFCLKADIKHYFQEVNHNILMKIIKKKIGDENVLWLIDQINANFGMQRERESYFPGWKGTKECPWAT